SRLAKDGEFSMICRPLMESEPESGQSGCSAPVMILIRVDLPAPFSPTSAWTSPARRSNETPLSARTAPNDFEIESTLSSMIFYSKLEDLSLIPRYSTGPSLTAQYPFPIGQSSDSVLAVFR